jgi:hypothetical protein
MVCETHFKRLPLPASPVPPGTVGVGPVGEGVTVCVAVGVTEAVKVTVGVMAQYSGTRASTVAATSVRSKFRSAVGAAGAAVGALQAANKNRLSTIQYFPAIFNVRNMILSIEQLHKQRAENGLF